MRISVSRSHCVASKESLAISHENGNWSLSFGFFIQRDFHWNSWLHNSYLKTIMLVFVLSLNIFKTPKRSDSRYLWQTGHVILIILKNSPWTIRSLNQRTWRPKRRHSRAMPRPEWKVSFYNLLSINFRPFYLLKSLKISSFTDNKNSSPPRKNKEKLTQREVASATSVLVSQSAPRECVEQPFKAPRRAWQSDFRGDLPVNAGKRSRKGLSGVTRILNKYFLYFPSRIKLKSVFQHIKVLFLKVEKSFFGDFFDKIFIIDVVTNSSTDRI